MTATNRGKESMRQDAQVRPGALLPFTCLDLLPDIILPNQLRQRVQLSTAMSGKRLLLLLCPRLDDPRCIEQLRGFAEASAEFEALVHVFVVTPSEPDNNARALAEAKLSFNVLSDLGGQVTQGLGIAYEPTTALSAQGSLSAVFADENRRIERVDRNHGDPHFAQQALTYLRGLPQRHPRRLGHFAPVLYVPKVLDRAFCRELIEAFEAGDPERGTVFGQDGGQEKGSYVVDPDTKVRRDFYVDDPQLKDRIKQALVRRVAPEIKKAFTRDITGVEDYKVVCYDALEGGKFRPHRDNTSEWHAHRRFAMTLNLNTEEYEGGALRFPEYGPDLYAPESGDAVVFSCALMHEATPVTSGRRFVLLSFMFDDESRQMNDRFRRKASQKA